MRALTWLAGGYAVFVALMLGSFINLAADRLPRRESIVAPRSHCRSCGRVLNAVDLAPVVGYLLRGGRCASCGTSIGLAAPLVEAACGAAMLLALIVFGLWPGALIGLGLIALISAAAVGSGYRTSRGVQTRISDG